MGVQVLTPESHHTKHLRSLPKLPNSHYSMKPLNTVKPSRALPTVPNTNVSKLDPNTKLARALPRVPKHMDNKKSVNRHGRALPEVPFRDVGNFKDTNTSSSSRASTPVRQNHNTSVNTHHSNSHSHHNTSNHGGASTHGNSTQRTLPKLPKLLQKQKPEQNRIEYMHDVYRKEGDIYSEDGNYEQALKSYNLALKFVSDEKTTIIARSRVYRKLGKLRKATQDADLALKLDPLYHEGLLQKAELLLEQGDYENALNYFQKGARMRPDKDDFHDGIEKAKHGLSENHKVARKRKNTLSPEDITLQKKSKDKTEKARKNRENVNVQAHQAKRTHSHMSDEDAHNNSYGSNTSSHRESVIQEETGHQRVPEVPKRVPAPPPNPPPAHSRAKLGRQMTPMPGRLKARLQETSLQQPNQNQQHQPMETQQHHPEQKTMPPPAAPPTVDDVDDDMMKQILGTMYKDREYLEKFLGDTENISMPGTTNIGSTAQTGLHFLYDRVLNWVRKGEAIPVVQPTPLPRETKTSAKRKSMMHGSSVESLMEEQEKENDARLHRRRKKKGQSKAPNTWYNYLEHKKLEEAQERKNTRNVFLHVVEGHKIKPKEHSNLEPRKTKQGPETSRNLHRNKEHDSKESLNQSFIFKSYRPGSDMRNSRDRRTPMEISDTEDRSQIRTPPKKLRHYGGSKEKLERRRLAVAKYAIKEVEEIEFLYADGRYDECLDKCRHVLKVLDNEDWPDKYQHMANIHSYIGNVYIGKKEYRQGLDHHEKDLAIGEKYKVDEAVSRALGNLGRVYVVQKRHQEALDVFLRKTPMCASRIETAWLFHEIGNCFLALGDFEYAKDAAKKSLEAAEEAVEWSYQLQSCVLMGVAEVKLKQYHAAFNTFEKALDQARLQGDEKAEDAIREALQDVNDRIVEEMRTKGPLNFAAESRSDNFMTPISRSNTTVTDYQLQGLSRSRAEIAKRQSDLGPRFRADYAKTPAAQSEYSSILIPDDDGDVSLTDTVGDMRDLNLDLERLRTESTIFGSSLDLRDHIRSETFVSGKGN